MKDCSKCGVMNPDEAQFCYNCGHTFVNAMPIGKVETIKKLVVYGPKEWYIGDKPVRIFIDDVLYCEVKRNEVKTMEIKRIHCTMKLTWGYFFSKCELYIPAEFEGKILIESNRWTGKFNAVLAM